MRKTWAGGGRHASRKTDLGSISSANQLTPSQQLRAAHSYLKDVAARVEVEQARRVAQAAEAGEKLAGQCEAPT